MGQLKGLRARMRSLFRSGAAEGRMDEEFLFHVEMETEKYVKLGFPPDEARRRARIAFGGMDRHREEMRDGRGARWLGDLVADVRYALRMLRRSPIFAAAAALTIALGIGLNGVVVSVINGLMFRPLPASHPEELVGVYMLDQRTGQTNALAYEDYADFRDRSNVFAGIAVHTGTPLNLQSGETRDMIWGEMVSENYFAVLAMQPALGRFFAPLGSGKAAMPSAVLSYLSWRERFHGDSSVVGRAVRINGTAFEILGVAPKGFKGVRVFGFWPEMWVPIGMHEVINPSWRSIMRGRGLGSLIAFARMQPGWTRERTERGAALFAQQLAQAYPASNERVSVRLVSAKAGYDNPAFVPPKLLVLASSLGTFGVTLVLVVICANIANLLLARTAARERELSIRLSLGCSRARLVRQLLVEAAVLAFPGVVLGIAASYLTPFVQQHMVPKLQFRVGFNVTPDSRVLLYTIATAVLAVLLVGLSPALRASRPVLVPALKSVIGPARAGERRGMRSVFVVVQLALSVVLIVAGSLFVRALASARAIDVGFEARDRVSLSVNLELQRYDTLRGRALYRDVLQRVRALPGVVSASWGFPVPFDSYGRGVGLYIDGLPRERGDGTIGVPASTVDVGFFDVLGVQILQGRAFGAEDSVGAPLRMIVSKTAAQRFWPDRDPIGQHARVGSAKGPTIEVVGVVDDVKFVTVGGAPGPYVYLSLGQNYRGWQSLVVHAPGAPEPTLRRLRQIIAEADPTLPAFGASTFDEAIASALNGAESAAAFASLFGVVALLIAATGLYALVAHAVTERTREIGVRMALGATPASVLRLMVGGAGRLVVVGLIFGIAGAAALSRVLGGLLYGVSPYDPLSFAAVPALLAGVVLVASYLPARRATRLDAAAALRE
jgi:predicted permease